MRPLTGIKVLDLSRVLAGPFCSQILSDLGADVIKVESLEGDETRRYEPVVDGVSCYYLAFNRNKRSIALNLKTSEAQDIIRELVRDADVLIENFRYGTMDQWGLGYEALKEINPRLVYCSISGFGRTGPLKDRPGYDLVMQAFSGLMSVTGVEEGPPVRTGWSIVDLTAGMWAALSIQAALLQRNQTGKGQFVESSLFEGQLGLMTYYATTYFATGQVGQRLGSAHFSLAPYQAFQTKDGYVIIAVGNDRLFAKLCKGLGAATLLEDERFQSNALRVRNRKELAKLLEKRTRQYESSELVELMDQSGVPCAPVQTIDQVLNHEQVAEREMVLACDYPGVGPVRMLRSPFRFSESEVKLERRPPLLSEHAEEILADLGLSKERIAQLKQAGIVL
ncbi:CaiB/BaiF CoA transferase family protein [Alicyclobacillus pomorum]|jgi:crotonobetainyl-CoA:carnitine CoA-transferase CaiB-like acyl-CoA transferase|uniref:CaiB/BaiF CoA transferase family protein n=1 Tax=Alicyclobacillus pomorum TaxID=204470 RepID=UPI00041ACABB|nr:CaiB/BaiF CoA-transferase family protein [Alicyclobacillus pomorum]